MKFKTKKILLTEKFEKGKTIDKEGNMLWFNDNGELHREGDKPAIIFSNGTMQWYKNGRRHRDEDKPAIIFSNGEMWWYQNGLRHRDEDKPAIIFSNGSKEWYQNGKFIKSEKNESRY